MLRASRIVFDREIKPCIVQRMPYPAKKPRLLPEILRLNREEELSIPEAAKAVGVHPVTAAKWIKEEGEDFISRPGRKPDPDALIDISCKNCNMAFEVYRHEVGKRQFCSRYCSDAWLSVNRAKKERSCLCGKKLQPRPGERYVASERKYCDAKCRKEHGTYREKDPENYLTFTCLGCGDAVTRLKKYSTYTKYCSNACAAKHTKAKLHIVVDNAVVLDSGYEALLWGLCSAFKVPIERYDRTGGVEWREGGWYAPDFLVSCHGRQVAVETKGLEDEHDQERWAAFRAQSGVPLVVLTQKELVPPPASREELLALLGLGG